MDSIIISFTIYVLAGREIFSKRKQLRAFSNPTRPVIVEVKNPFTSFKTTEIQITSELDTMEMTSPNMPRGYPGPNDKIDHVIASTKPTPSGSGFASRGYDQYSVEIASTPISPAFEMPHTTTKETTTMQIKSNKVAMEANTAAWGYTKVALLFFVSLLVTWVCPTANRMYHLPPRHPPTDAQIPRFLPR